ncbi:Mitomycin radical oxidase [Cytospora mali]|uniref:Mitomycin radical oxidase n=1 Tax=Cytospora mali TaxID=578113 RepID=A0A194W5T4_CYTMA|nr:Mitomycin radical oxidase [Valsa mali]
MTSQSVPAPSLPPWAEPLTASLSAEPQFHERQVLYFPGSPEFADSENDYFNGAVREAQSVAVVRPTSTADVSALLRILRRHLPTTTPIAVRGAGHATYVGTAKASGGVTIDLRGLRGIDVLAGDRHVRIAAGEKWHSVLAALESHKPPLTTVGGRSPNIDAIGFLLGAGLSGLSAGFGFSADMVTSWEEKSITARRDDSKTADLWDALRGRSTNFGIVTAVEMSCFPHPALFRGCTPFYLPSSRQETLKALYRVASIPLPKEGEPINHAIWSITQTFGLRFFNAMITTTGSEKQENLRDFTGVWGRIPFNTGSLQASSHGQFVERMGKLAPEGGKRSLGTLYKSITVKLNFDLLNAAVDLWYKSADLVRPVAGHIHTLVITATSESTSPAAGTSNFLGLKPKDGPLLLVQICTTYNNAKVDVFVAEADTKYLDEVAALARQMGLEHRYIFANYA